MPRRPSATAAIPATAPPAIAPTLVLDDFELGLDPPVELVLLLLLVPPPVLVFPAVVVFSVIMVSRSGSLQPLTGAFLVEPPFLLPGD